MENTDTSAQFSVGPIDGTRHAELKHLFAKSTAGLVVIAAFTDRALIARFPGPH